MLVLLLGISALAASALAGQLLKPVNAIDLDDPQIPATYPELEPLVDRLKEQKETISAQTAERERMRREFTANVSHELKTPLTSISGFAELISEGMCSEDMMKEFSKDIYKESQRMITLVDDILRLSKLDEEGVGTEFEMVDLYSVAEDVIDILTPQADKKNVKLSLEGEAAAVRGVWQIIYEMVFNLCDNAIKYNREGGSAFVSIGSSAEGRPSITVKDTGIGIPQGEQERVFERFYRVDKSHSKAIGGTGLGLSIVKHGAQLHNAAIRMESSSGKGTKIELIF